jgi:hypothetical protein
MCNVHSSAIQASETISSLGFASKVSAVQLKAPERKIEDADADDGEQCVTTPHPTLIHVPVFPISPQPLQLTTNAM